MICAQQGQCSFVAILPEGSSLLFFEDEEKSFLLANIWNSAATHDGVGFCRSAIARLPPPALGAEAPPLPFFMSPRPQENSNSILLSPCTGMHVLPLNLGCLLTPAHTYKAQNKCKKQKRGGGGEVLNQGLGISLS